MVDQELFQIPSGVSPIQTVRINERLIIGNANNLKHIIRGRIQPKYLPNNKKELCAFKLLHSNCSGNKVRTLIDKKFKRISNDKIGDNIK